MSYNPPPQIDIDFTCENEEQAEKYLPRLNAIREKFLCQPWNENTKLELQHEILSLDHYIYANEESSNITVELKGPAAYNNTRWSLEELLKYYKEYYPERYEDKEIYRRIDVNNMLFDLELKGVIKGYECVALPYSIAEKHNNKPFPSDETISVGEKYNVKYSELHRGNGVDLSYVDLVTVCDLNKLMED